MSKNPGHFIKQECSGMFMVTGNQGPTSERNYMTMKQDERFILPKGQIMPSSAAFPVEMFQNKDSVQMDDTVIRRTRSLIPHSVKCQIIQLAQDNPRITQGEIAQMFGIDRTTVSKILKRRHKFLEESGSNPCTSLSSPPKMLKTDDVVNEALYNYINLWYLDATKKGEIVTQSKIIEVAKTMAKTYGIADLSLDTEWLCKFFLQYNIKDPDIEDLVKKEYASSSDELPAVFIEPTSLTSPVSDVREVSPKTANFNKTKPGNRSHRPAISPQHVSTTPRQSPSATVSSSQQGTGSPGLSSRPGTGNKIPRVQTETADTTRDDLVDVRKDIDELDSSEALKREMGNLEKFREQQKMIEEANKQRKALLSKTLSERQKAAQQEARKLAHIQRELMILDNLLTADVNVIRSRIEVASRDFLDAQKRYERAEKEFVDSKIDLQKKSELKEHLTEHLYTIIHQNELRKSQKLSELMKELEMEQSAESQILPSIPSLSSFNTMSTVQTLHTPKSPTHTSPENTDQNVKPNNQTENVKPNEQTENVKLSDISKNVKESDQVDSAKSSDSLKNVKQSDQAENVKHSDNENVKQTNETDHVKQRVTIDLTTEVKKPTSDDKSKFSDDSEHVKKLNDNPVSPSVTASGDAQQNTVEGRDQQNTGKKGDNEGGNGNNIILSQNKESLNDTMNEVTINLVDTESEVQDQQGTTELPSSWTLDIVKQEPGT